jgi:hypothetical protein
MNMVDFLEESRAGMADISAQLLPASAPRDRLRQLRRLSST